MFQRIAKEWSLLLLLLRNTLAVLLFITAFGWPGLSLLVRVKLFVGYLFLDGVTALLLGIKGDGVGER